jgi:hypothetical protein
VFSPRSQSLVSMDHPISGAYSSRARTPPQESGPRTRPGFFETPPARDR